MKKSFRVISLGAGVQSSTLALLYENNHIKQKPDIAIFADTMAEPKEVYQYLEFLKQKVKSFPIVTCSTGNLVKDVENSILSPPFFVRKSDSQYQEELEAWEEERKMANYIPAMKPKKIGMLRRQCTYNYKITAVRQEIRKKLGYQKYQRVKENVEMILGISTDEITRMKDSSVKWITHKFPLIEELNWSRKDCLKYFRKYRLPTPPRSACWMCPYKNDDEWIYLKERHPKEFIKAINFDKKIRKISGTTTYQYYLHRSCRPLDEITFHPKRTDDALDAFSGMNNECDGLCGV